MKILQKSIINTLSCGLYNKTIYYLEWLKLHTMYSRLDYYSHSAFLSTTIGVTDKKRKQEITVSITTYGERIHNVHCVIESLMQQTVKADKIIIWLCEKEYTKKKIPLSLNKLQERGLTINFCEDIRSYKKIIPTLLKYPNNIIITADDDIIYPFDHIERLYNAYLQEPNIIHCNRAHLIKLNKSNEIKPYKKWNYETTHKLASIFILPTTGAGAIYFPGCFDNEVLNKTAFMELCPFADDIWLKLMSVRSSTLCKIIAFPTPLNHYIKIPSLHEKSLTIINRTQNDIQIQNILRRYPDIKRHLTERNT